MGKEPLDIAASQKEVTVKCLEMGILHGLVGGRMRKEEEAKERSKRQGERRIGGELDLRC